MSGANGAYMAARHADRAAADGFRLLIWRHAERETLHYADPAEALAAAVEYLKAGYQCRLGGELVGHFAAEPTPRPMWFPSWRDWRLLDGMLRRAISTPGFFHAAAESAGRAEAERLAARTGELLDALRRAL